MRPVRSGKVYLHRLAAAVAAMATSAGGLDAIAFTGGVGENDACGPTPWPAWPGWERPSTPGANGEAHGDRVVSPAGAHPAVCVVAAREDLEIAAEARRTAGP